MINFLYVTYDSMTFMDWSYFMYFCSSERYTVFLPILRIQSTDEAIRRDLNFSSATSRRAKASTKLLPALPHFATRKVRRVIWMWVKSLLLVKHVSRAPQ